MNPVQLPAPVCASLVGTNLEITVLPRAVRGLYRAFRSDVEMVVLRSKAGVSPDLPVESVHSNSCGKRVWKTQNNPPSASAAFEALGCRCPVFLVLAPACAAVRFGLLLLSTLSRLTVALITVITR